MRISPSIPTIASSKFGISSSQSLPSPSQPLPASSLAELLSVPTADQATTSLSILNFGSQLARSPQSDALLNQPTPSPQASVLDSIKSRLGSLQSLYSQASQTQDSETRESLQSSIDTTISEISTLANLSMTLGGARYAQVEPWNPSQVANLAVQNLAPNTSFELEAEVTTAADRARLTVLGTQSQTIGDTVSVALGGSAGSVTMTWNRGESLASIAQRVNDLSAATGVVASAYDSILVLESTTVGSSGQVSLNAIAYTNSLQTSGVNARQISRLTSDQFLAGQSVSISGQVTQAAQRAEVRYAGDGRGQVAGDATVQITGSRGRAEIEFWQSESLESVADRINAAANRTGATASVDEGVLVIQSIEVGSQATLSVDAIDHGATLSVEGINSQQIGNANLNRASSTLDTELRGEVVATATRGALTIQGSDLGAARGDATFQVTGVAGSIVVDVVAEESLQAVADRINSQQAQTGVIASVQGTNLLLEAAELGSASFVDAQLITAPQELSITNVNSAQFDQVTVSSFADESSVTLSGSIEQAASAAQVSINSSRLNNKTFTITSQQGTLEVQIDVGEGTASDLERINAATAAIGVQVRRDGSNLNFSTIQKGSDQTLNVEVRTTVAGMVSLVGTYNSQGTDVQANINGQLIVGDGDRLSVDLAEGSIELTAASDFVGTFDPITIASQQNSFALSDGATQGSSYGSDVQFESDGQVFTGSGDRLTIETDSFSIDVEFAPSFLGEIDPLTLKKSPDFEWIGGGLTASGVGEDVVVELNGNVIEGEGSRFELVTNSGTIQLEFTEGFEGELQTVTAVGAPSRFAILFSGETGFDRGRDAVVQVGAQQFSGSGTDVTLNLAQASLRLSLVEGFAGTLDPIAINGTANALASSSATHEGLSPEPVNSQLQSLVQALAPFLSGGEYSLAQANEPRGEVVLNEVIERIASLQVVEEMPAPSSTGSASNDDSSLSDARAAAALVAETYQQLFLTEGLRTLDVNQLIAYSDFASRRRVLSLLW